MHMTTLHTSILRPGLYAALIVLLSAWIPFTTIADEALATVKAPDFEVRYVDSDSKLKLSDYAGKVVLVNFWASWCYPCLVEMPEFQKIYDKFKDKGFAVLAVAVFDKLPDAKAFQDEYKFTFPVLFDDQEQAKAAFGVEVVPQTFLVGRDGLLIPIPNPKTNESKLRVNDVTIWVQPETYDFLAEVVEN